MSTLIRDTSKVTEADKKLIKWMREFADDWKNPALNGEFHAFAKEITRQVMEEYTYVDFTPYIFETSNLSRDTHKIVFRELKGYTATTVSSGGRRQQFRLDKTRTHIWIPDEYENATVEVNEEDMREGNYGTVADIRAGLRDALVRKKLARVMEELHRLCNASEDDADWDGTSTAAGNENFIYNPGSTLNVDAVKFAIRKVIGRTGGVVSMVGHPDYLLQVCDFPNFLPYEAPEKVKEELHQNGFIGKWRGANIVTVSEYEDKKTGKQVWDPYNIYIIGKGMAEIANIYGIDAVSDFEAMRSIRLIGGDQKYVVLSQDPQLKRGFRIQMQ